MNKLMLLLSLIFMSCQVVENPKDLIYYHIVYDANGSQGSTPIDSNNYWITDNVVLKGNESLNKTSFIFNGWNTSSDGKGTPYNAGDTLQLKQTTVLYAQWVADMFEFIDYLDGYQVCIKYDINNNVIGTNVMGVLEIPTYYNKKPILSTGNFGGSVPLFTHLIIPETVTAINENTFCNNTHMCSIELPKTLTYIGKYAFSYCSKLAYIEIPASVTFIGNYVFQSCQSLSSVKMFSATPPSVGAFVFDAKYFPYGVDNKVVIYVPNLYLNVYIQNNVAWSSYSSQIVGY